jgi:hypothetical protein
VTALSYYAELDVMDFVTAKTKGVIAIRLPSENIFSYELKVNSFFGTPLSVSPGSLAMDVDRAMILVKSLDGNKDKSMQFTRGSGINSSALEHSVPELFFSTAENPAFGISAIRALKIANDQGIPIYTINQSNINTILPQLQLDSGTISDIQNAVNAGKIVTVSKNDITFNGWTGCGYIIIDPNTGAGAYMISGGFNGAVIAIFFGALLMIVGLFVLVATGPFAPMGILLIMAGIAAFSDGLTKYLGDLSEKEVKYFNCLLPVYISILLGIIIYELSGPYVIPILIKLFEVIHGVEVTGKVSECIGKLE